jgi:ubiquinone/menaquinone biosynthesis C-methylase UbiE
MTSVTMSSAQMWGRLWGTAARDWAAVEERQLPTYTRALHHLGIGADEERVLDVGCGTGVFLREAADRGATVAGLDASDALVTIARERVPAADLHVGDMEALPFADDAFDIVTGFCSFFYADDMTRALREAARVTKPDGIVLVQVFGRPERCAIDEMKSALLQLVPMASDGPPYWRMDVLERITRDAGLTPLEAFYSSWAFEFPDQESMLRAMLSGGNTVAAVEYAGREAVESAICEALEPYRADDGSYRLDNEWHYFVTQMR